MHTIIHVYIESRETNGPRQRRITFGVYIVEDWRKMLAITEEGVDGILSIIGKYLAFRKDYWLCVASALGCGSGMGGFCSSVFHPFFALVHGNDDVQLRLCDDFWRCSCEVWSVFSQDFGETRFRKIQWISIGNCNYEIKIVFLIIYESRQ